MFDVIHMLSKHYGWRKEDILNGCYPDEVQAYIKRIRRDEANSNLTQLALIHNPHSKEPGKLVRQLEQQIKSMSDKYFNQEEMDEENKRKLMEAKRRMQENARKRRN